MARTKTSTRDDTKPFYIPILYICILHREKFAFITNRKTATHFTCAFIRRPVSDQKCIVDDDTKHVMIFDASTLILK